ncbi:MAG: Ig domain-containing protein [archaeon]
MKKKKTIFFYCLILLAEATLIFGTECEHKPIIDMPSYLTMYEGKGYYDKINLENNLSPVFFSWAPINSTLIGFNVNETTGVINFTPKNTEIGLHKIIIIAVDNNDCAGTELVNIRVLGKPIITDFFPTSKKLFVNEGSFIAFYVNTSHDSTKNNLFSYTWYADSLLISKNQKYTYFPNFSNSGEHIIKAVIKDTNDLNTSIEWEVVVRNVNLAPYLKANLPNIILSPNQKIALYNLNDYFADDGAFFLDYYPFFIKGSEVTNISPFFDINISEYGETTFASKTSILFKERAMIIAFDRDGKNKSSNIFEISIAYNSTATKPYQESKKEECIAKIVCAEWSLCLPTGIMVRDCLDSNNCNKENETVTESKACEYNASCLDNIKNQDEIGVDCGGICPPCATCFDEFQNQGEDGVDCGGPCKPCPSCNDLLKNQDETDIDCGGNICMPCEPGKMCLSHMDCISENCVNESCARPTCIDNIINQNETWIDCGGECKQCITCVDKIQNQGETGIDCGGPCGPCETCFDGIKNQRESEVDCGGSCKKCTAKFAVSPIALSILIVFLLIAASLFITYKISNIFFLSTLNEKLFFFMKTNNSENEHKAEQTVSELSALKSSQATYGKDKQSTEQYNKVMQTFFKNVFLLDEKDSIDYFKKILNLKVKNPITQKILIFLYKEMHKNEMEFFYSLELSSKIDDTIKLINQIKKYI